MSKKSLLAVAACAAAIAAFGTNAALAGEVTGSGENADQNQGKSWCSYSGLNDDPGASTEPPIGPNGPGGQSQSYGQDVRLGLADPHEKEGGPGVLCNPNKSPLPDFPNNEKKNP
jgi:hypothetical protein